MKKIILTVALVFFVLTFIVIDIKDSKNQRKIDNGADNQEEKAIYVSYIEFNSYIKDKDSNTSKKNIIKMLDDIKEYGFNNVIVHVRPFSDSIYKSEFYPVSSTVLNDKGVYPDYDVLEYFITEAHKRNIRFEAWVNPFRVSNITDLSQIPIDSPYYDFVKTGDAKIIEGKGIYLNPASSKVEELVVNGIEEIVKNYDVDAIHFDDYFYPDKEIDLASYSEYKKNGGNLSIDQYRLNIISSFIKNVYSAIKNTKKDVLFGIAPEGNIENDYENNFLDVNLILGNEGYVDYIMPQIYFGFENETKPFISTIGVWNSLIKVDSIKLIPALAFYKIGVIDQYAGSGKDEWINNDNIIKKQILIARNQSNYGGFSLFRYDYIFNEEKHNDNTKEEIKNIKEILK